MRHALVLLLLAIPTNLGIAEDKVDFTDQIHPIFVEHCAKCHGEKNAKGDIRLHDPAGIREAGIDHLLNPAKPDEGELLARITLPAGDDLLMPKGADPLTQETIDLIRMWIELGLKCPKALNRLSRKKIHFRMYLLRPRRLLKNSWHLALKCWPSTRIVPC